MRNGNEWSSAKKRLNIEPREQTRTWTSCCFGGFLKQLKVCEFSRESFNFPPVFYFNFKLSSLLWSLFSKVQQKTLQNPIIFLCIIFFLPCLPLFPEKIPNSIRSVWGGLVMLTSESLTRSNTSIIKTTWGYSRELCELLEWRIYCTWTNWCLSLLYSSKITQIVFQGFRTEAYWLR